METANFTISQPQQAIVIRVIESVLYGLEPKLNDEDKRELTAALDYIINGDVVNDLKIGHWLFSKQSTQQVYRFEYGDKIFTICDPDTDFFEKLQKLPADLKIRMMGIKEDEASAYFKSKAMDKAKVLLKLLDDKWYSRDTGEHVELNADFIGHNIPEFKFSAEQIKKKLKSKNPPSGVIISKLINLLGGENSELYTQ